MRYAAFIVCSIPLLAVDPEAVLKGIEARYNSAKTLQVGFAETYTVVQRGTKTESGQLFLRKPSRMRWEYAAPSGKFFVSDGKDVYYYNPEENRAEKMKLKDSEDMRAPMAFLLGKLDFRKEFTNVLVREEGGSFIVTGLAKSEQLPYTSVKFTVARDYQIQKLLVVGTDQSLLEFAFDKEVMNPTVNDTMFHFKLPPGAELVDTSK